MAQCQFHIQCTQWFYTVLLLCRYNNCDDSDYDADDESSDTESDEVYDHKAKRHLKNPADDTPEERFEVEHEQVYITDTKAMKPKKTKASKRKKIKTSKSKRPKLPKSSQPKGKDLMGYDTTNAPICASWDGRTMLNQHHHPRKRIRNKEPTAAVDQSVTTLPVQCFDTD